MKSILVFLVCLVATTAAFSTTTTQSSAGCGNTSYSGPTGVISSPNFPGNYNNDLSCGYYIEAAKISSLSIIFKLFNTEENADFVTISCLANSSFPPQQFSGFSLPNPVSLPWCSRGLIHFDTNENVGATGFSLDYHVSNGGCGNTLYTESNGSVTSPNFPSNYGYDHNCSNIIWAPERSNFHLFFVHFLIYGDCFHDWLEISCLDNLEYGPYRYCGHNTNATLDIYGCTQLLLWFHSDSTNNSQGFNIQYDYYPESEATTQTVATTPPPVTNFNPGCGNSAYYGSSGVISSPNHPGNYSNDLYCDYYIYAEVGSSLSFFFNSFKTEGCCDFVTISCPTNSSFSPQQFSGETLPVPVSIPWCSQGLVHFSTDESIGSSGFSLEYYVSNGGCGNTVHGGDDYGYIYSPRAVYVGSGAYLYGYNHNCSIIVWASESSDFSIEFYYGFDLEKGDCSRDWLEVSCLDNPQLGSSRHCGDDNSYQGYFSGCYKMLLWFHTDGLNNYPGFEIQYRIFETYVPQSSTVTVISGSTVHTVGTSTTPPLLTTTTIDPICGENSFSGSYGIVHSPNYPGYYYDNLDCYYFVDASTGSSLLFVFVSFHVEDSDLVTISCSSNSNFPPQEYSEHTLPVPVSISLCSQGKVNFRTDGTNVSSGFSLEYYVSDAGCGNTLYTGSNGYLNSPNWPEYYGYNQNCTNIIWAPQQSTIHLYFHSFNLQDDCNCDWLEITCLDNSEVGPTRYCGNYNSYDLCIYGCSQVLVWFHSDDSYNFQGYFIEHTIYPVEACGEMSYYGPSGVINSPNYPGNYSNFLYCDYTIYASTGNSLLLIFDPLQIQEGFDLVTISCPANSSFPKRELTGDYLPNPLSIPDCSQGLVNFHTDHTVVARGFSLKYYISEGGCENTVYTSNNGQVTSPNWPSKYGHNQNCYNLIFISERTSFHLNFQSFILQNCCDCDWLEISCLDNSEYGPTRYCEYHASFDIYINNCSQVLLWFHSDYSGNDQGFNIEYNVLNNADDRKVLTRGLHNSK